MAKKNKKNKKDNPGDLATRERNKGGRPPKMIPGIDASFEEIVDAVLRTPPRKNEKVRGEE